MGDEKILESALKSTNIIRIDRDGSPDEKNFYANSASTFGALSPSQKPIEPTSLEGSNYINNSSIEFDVINSTNSGIMRKPNNLERITERPKKKKSLRSSKTEQKKGRKGSSSMRKNKKQANLDDILKLSLSLAKKSKS